MDSLKEELNIDEFETKVEIVYIKEEILQSSNVENTCSKEETCTIEDTCTVEDTFTEDSFTVEDTEIKGKP